MISPGFDWTWFVAPGVVAVLLSAFLVWQQPREGPESLLLWVGSVLLVDVAHVYASLYRTYLDPEARRLHGRKLWIIPAAVLWFGTLIHLASPLAFWTLLAYVAVFHFIKQHEGFAALLVRAGREDAAARRWVRAAIWAGTLAPVIYWHAQLPRNFAWFLQGDFIEGLPAWVGTLAVWAQVPVLLGFAIDRLRRARRGQRNPTLIALVLLPALTWNMGIVWFDDDRVFTLTNVLLHGVPYLALVWVTGGRTQVESRVGGWSRAPLVLIAAFYLLLCALAFTEEALWDRWVWHEHVELFGESETSLQGLGLAVAVALLTVPQATHYVLDRFIWRPGPQNPHLARQLGFEER